MHHLAQFYSTVEVCDASKADSSNSAGLKIISRFLCPLTKVNGNELSDELRASFSKIIEQFLISFITITECILNS
jgi:hypothetical protein